MMQRVSVETAESGRDLATLRLVQRMSTYPEFDLAPVDSGADHLPDRERSLARAIDHAAVRHWLTLVHLLSGIVKQPWDELQSSVQAALMSGAAQLAYLDRVPPHAAISETVTWSKKNVRAGAGGLINAVLRRFADLLEEKLESFDVHAADQIPRSDGTAWRVTAGVLPESEVERLAVVTSHPHAVAERWSRLLGPETARALMLHDLVQAPMILIGASPDDSPFLEPHDEPGCLIFTGDRAALAEGMASHPRWRVQDATTARSVNATRDLSPAVIIDACAGRGTKTGQLAELHPDAQVIATDVDDERRSALRASWSDHPRITIIEPDELVDWKTRADLLVLDVPCSNTGVLARRLEARYRATDTSLSGLTDIQRQIIADALALLAPGGVLLYATCSIEPAENEGVADWILQWHPFDELSRETTMPTGLPGESANRYRDGGFHSMLQRRM